ncbi:MAG TPA: aldehyde dehydrogenase family protein [Streptosporangiaceae bacterium]|nr:aldehyde dehydrogenase family protein [Streptosporangiaceae bacterium]
MVSTEHLLIDGKRVPGSSGSCFDSVNPADGTVLARVPAGNADDGDHAVAAASAALESPEWRDLMPAARARLLWRLADLIEARASELALLETSDQGQPLSIAANVSIPFAAEVIRYYAGWCTKIEGSTAPVSVPGTFFYTRREPLGVCALITPWNFPLMIAAWKVAPALATGNTVVLKPAEETPLTTLFLGRLALEAGFPAGVVNVVTGGPEAGAALVAHPDVRKVSFTGSTEVGKVIQRAAADNLTRVSLELGGKAPSIIAPDADIDAAVTGNLQGALLNSGQVCKAYTRFYVARPVAEEFTEKLSQAAASIKLGPGGAPETELGPLVSARHIADVERLVATGVADGAELRTGGRRSDGRLADGYFFQPTVFSGVRDGMTIAREEIFGPVLSVLTYDDPDEVVARANDSDYGLAAAIWTNDLSYAHRTAAQLRAGTVYVNMLPLLDPAAIHGGFGASGFGRELGPAGIEEFTEDKGVWLGL